jgi:hypothetical protein
MKITHKTSKTTFQPITLNIVLESQAEVDTLYQLGNYGSSVQDFMKKDLSPSLPYDAVLTHFYKALSQFATNKY